MFLRNCNVYMTELRECLRTVVKVMFLTLRRNVYKQKFRNGSLYTTETNCLLMKMFKKCKGILPFLTLIDRQQC